MAKRVQRRRGTTSEHSGFTGAEGEITVDTTIDTLVVHDGSTPGGHPVAKADGSNIANNSIGILQLNVADGQDGWFLKTNGAGTLSFAPVDVGGTALGGSKLGGTIANATIDEDAVGVYELNVDEGTAGYFLKTDGAGGLSFAEVVTDPTMAGDVGGITSNNAIGAGKINPAHLSTPLKTFTVDDGIGSLGVDTFALSAAPGSVNAIIVYIDGIVQPPSAYSLGTNPNQIVFTTDPPVGSIIRILHLGFQSTVGIPSDGTITNAKLATNSVESDNIVNKTIATEDIADDAITEALIAAQTITEASITPNTITNISIANATVTGTQIADNAIDGTKISIAGNQQGDIMSYDGTNWVRNIAGNVQGDILYHNGTSWVRLPAGTATHVLTTTGAGANPYWAAGSSGTALPSVGADGNVLTSDGTNWASEAPTAAGVAPGTAGNVLTSDGTNWTSASSQLSQSDEEILLLEEGTPTTARTGTWTKPTGVTHIQVSVAAGGGRGGADGLDGSGNPVPGGTGGIGGFATRIIDVRNIASIDYYIGRGGGTVGAMVAERTSFGASRDANLPTGSLTVTVVAGAITAITGGFGSTVTSTPLIFIEPNATSLTGRDGTGAVATAVVAGGQVTGITINNGGSGYVTGQVQAFYGIHATGGAEGAGGGNGSLGTAGLGFGGRGNLIVNLDKSGWPLAQLGTGGGGEPAGGGASGGGGHGGIYIRSYK
jgi:hypothetical protein